MNKIADRARCGIYAVEHDNEAIVQVLLYIREVVHVNSRDKDGLTPLYMAAKNGHAAVVELLLGRKEIDVCSKDNLGLTASYWAAENGHVEVRELLDLAAGNKGQAGANREQPLSLEPTSSYAVVINFIRLGKADVPSEKSPNHQHHASVPFPSAQEPTISEISDAKTNDGNKLLSKPTTSTSFQAQFISSLFPSLVHLSIYFTYGDINASFLPGFLILITFFLSYVIV
jgi:hypothetical protein